MKKGLLICLMFLSIFIFVGCTRGTTLNLNYDEQINEPQNLEISGTVLSWSSVTDAEGYIVYINDEEAAKVSTNSYDFSSKVENRLIFNVVTRAPRGMQDSAFSASIAYVANKASEISQINSYANTNDMDLPEGFAEEVVNKGLLASEFEAMMDSMQSMTEDLSNVDDMDDYFDVVNDVMEDVVHAEALVSAVVKTVLPDRISNEMVWIQNEIDMYQNMIDEGYYYYDIPYYQARIDELQLQYDALEELLDEIETNPEAIVQSVMVVVDYVMSIQSLISEDFIDALMSLSESDDLKDINVDEFMLIKEEIVDVLTQSMPDSKDVTVMMRTMESLANIAGATQNVEVALPSSPEKLAGEMLMSIEAFINFIDVIDRNFIETVIEIDEKNISDYHKQAEMMTLVITYFDRFKRDNQGLLDQISDVYTDEEKEDLLNDYIDLMEEQFEAEDMDVTLSFMSYEVLSDMEVIFEDAFDDLLDAFVASDGAILTLRADLDERRDRYYDNPIQWADYSLDSEVIQFKMFNEIAYLVNAVVKEISSADYEVLSGFMVDVFYYTYSGYISTNMERFKTDFVTFYESTTTEQYNLIKNLVNFIDQKDVFLNYATDLNNTFEDYPEEKNAEEMYVMVVHFLRAYDDFMNRSNKRDVNTIIDQLEILLDSNTVYAYMDSDHLADLIRDLMEYMDTVAGDIGNYDATDLSRSQEDAIDDFILEIEDIVAD